MILSGLSGKPSKCCLLRPSARIPRELVSSFSNGNFRENIDLQYLKRFCSLIHVSVLMWSLEVIIHYIVVQCRSCWTGPALRCKTLQIRHTTKCAFDASPEDFANESTAVFPRINVRDPYKRLGISKEASEDEIQAARNFLIHRYAGHKESVDAIESAHDKIIMQKFYDRRNPKIDIKKKVREVNQSRVVQAIRSRFQTPSTKFIIKSSIAFLVLGVLTILFPTEEGPTLQVAISLIATFYFIHDRLKSKLRAFLYGAGAFIFSWLVGTFLMVSVIPPVIKGLRGFEVTTSLITYILLWVSSTYLK